MVKTLILVLLIMVVGYFIIWGLVSLYFKMTREEDEDLQIRKETNRELKENIKELESKL